MQEGYLVFGKFGTPNDCDNCIIFGHCSIDNCKASIQEIDDMLDGDSARGMSGEVHFKRF